MGGGASAAEHVRSLVALLPLGLALVDRDGRFLQMNDAFGRAKIAISNTPDLS